MRPEHWTNWQGALTACQARQRSMGHRVFFHEDACIDRPVRPRRGTMVWLEEHGISRSALALALPSSQAHFISCEHHRVEFQLTGNKGVGAVSCSPPPASHENSWPGRRRRFAPPNDILCKPDKKPEQNTTVCDYSGPCASSTAS